MESTSRKLADSPGASYETPIRARHLSINLNDILSSALEPSLNLINIANSSARGALDLAGELADGLNEGFGSSDTLGGSTQQPPLNLIDDAVSSLGNAFNTAADMVGNAIDDLAFTETSIFGTSGIGENNAAANIVGSLTGGLNGELGGTSSALRGSTSIGLGRSTLFSTASIFSRYLVDSGEILSLLTSLFPAFDPVAGLQIVGDTLDLDALARCLSECAPRVTLSDVTEQLGASLWLFSSSSS